MADSARAKECRKRAPEGSLTRIGPIEDPCIKVKGHDGPHENGAGQGWAPEPAEPSGG